MPTASAKSKVLTSMTWSLQAVNCSTWRSTTETTSPWPRRVRVGLSQPDRRLLDHVELPPRVAGEDWTVGRTRDGRGAPGFDRQGGNREGLARVARRSRLGWQASRHLAKLHEDTGEG